jgi:hypothetical protein
MGENDKPKDGTISKVGTELFPFWKSAGPMNKFWMIFGPVSVIVPTIWKPWKKELPTSEQVSTQSGNGNSLNQAGRDVVIVNPSSPSEVDTKQDIRTILESVNPEILRQIDAGSPSVKVLISSMHRTKLAMLSDRPSFSKYLSFGAPDAVVVGARNILGGYLNDIGDESDQNAMMLLPKDALKK